MQRAPFDPDRIAAQPQAPSDGRGDSGPLTVSALTALVKRAIETHLPATVHVVGQISNFKRHGSGHLYFTLTDDQSALSCVVWRSVADKMKFDPVDGLEVIAHGRIDLFERTGRYQLHVRRLEPRGVGALELKFRRLQAKLRAEGLFDDRHKQPLPRFPRRIVLITSPTGAAVRDILHTLRQRFGCLQVWVYPVKVQGPGAAMEIAQALDDVNAGSDTLGGVDLIIVGRGGGSLEDLWAFNEETVARAIHRSRIPIISAVGHEVDVTIADLVADVRAATPTAAAQLAVPMLDELLTTLDRYQVSVSRTLHRTVELARARLGGLAARRPFAEPATLVHRRGQEIDEIAGRFLRRCVHLLHQGRTRVDRLIPSVEKIAPHAYWSRASVRLRDVEYGLRWANARRMEAARGSVDRGERRLDTSSPVHLMAQVGRRLARAGQGLEASWHRRLRAGESRLDTLRALLGALSYKRVLGRGYSITRTKKGRRLVRSIGQLDDRTRLVTELADGEFEAEVVNLRQLELFD